MTHFFYSRRMLFRRATLSVGHSDWNFFILLCHNDYLDEWIEILNFLQLSGSMRGHLPDRDTTNVGILFSYSLVFVMSDIFFLQSPSPQYQCCGCSWKIIRYNNGGRTDYPYHNGYFETLFKLVYLSHLS